MEKENFCQTLALNDGLKFSKLNSPVQKKLYCRDAINIVNILYFLYQQENGVQSYEDWCCTLFSTVLTTDRTRAYYSKWSNNKLLNYIALKKHIKITVINQQRCSTSKEGYHARHMNKKCFINVCIFNSYITCLNPVYTQYTFVTKKGKYGGIFYLKGSPFFKILYSTRKPD